MAGIGRIAVPPVGLPKYPTVLVQDAIADHLGLVSLIAGTTARSNRVDAMQAMVTAKNLDPPGTLYGALATRLQSRGLAIAPMTADPAPAFAAPNPRHHPPAIRHLPPQRDGPRHGRADPDGAMITRNPVLKGTRQ